MPQLNPAPWFTTLLTLWLLFMLVLKPGLLMFTRLKPPTPHPNKQRSHHWNWPWL
uniref:ATP synthase complex subunit 8 n=1 Tax=Tarentola mauritanica TaxID=8569 RepID=H9CX11_TARMA|nr:ATP synthase F0 subunit 8 [Tarentola mauritanica]